ncbi:MAG TPA: hypothetical protein GXZ32_05860 [Clostridiales bacterium]|jgi:hypothetical protein|nr:hypothetical protein [Clostridiales bacterium]
MKIYGLICLGVAAFLVYGANWIAGFVVKDNATGSFRRELIIKVIGMIIAILSVLVIMDII